MHAYRDQYAQLFHDGRNVVLIGISTDPVEALASWSTDDEFPFLFASDTGGVIGKTYGAHNPKVGLDNRNLFVVGPDGKIAYTMAPFREIDPQSYKDLAGAIDRITPKPAEGQ
jgi:peroxiredoxin